MDIRGSLHLEDKSIFPVLLNDVSNIMFVTRLGMELILKKLGVFAVACMGVLLSYVCFLIWIRSDPEALSARAQMGDSFGTLNALFTALGFVGVSATLWLQRQQIQSQERERVEEARERTSLYNLNASLDATNRAKFLLEDHNNDRRTWIEAGRLLAHAKSLGEGVTLPAHRKVLEINRLRYRSFFSGLLEHRDPRFFYGVQVEGETLEDYAIASSIPDQASSERISISSVRYLEEASIYRVWEAGQWPDNFEDPIGRRFSAEERGKLLFQANGLRQYLEHRDRWSAAAGVLRERLPAGSPPAPLGAD